MRHLVDMNSSDSEKKDVIQWHEALAGVLFVMYALLTNFWLEM